MFCFVFPRLKCFLANSVIMSKKMTADVTDGFLLSNAGFSEQQFQISSPVLSQ